MPPILLALLLGIYSLPARPCDCIMTPLQEHVRNTPFLMRATATRILDGTTPEGRSYREFYKQLGGPGWQIDTIKGRTALVRIEEDYKGRFRAGDTLAVYSDYSFDVTGFDVGKQYVLFLHLQRGRYFLTDCSYSTALNGSTDSKELLAVIWQLTKKKRRHMP